MLGPISGLISASEKQVLELVRGVEALPRWFGSGKGHCDDCDRFTALTMEQLNSTRDVIYASWASENSVDKSQARATTVAVPVPQVYGSALARRETKHQPTIALSTLDSTAVRRALELSGVATSVVEAVHSDDLDGRALAEVDEQYLEGLDATVGNGNSGGAARLKRKAFLRSETSSSAPSVVSFATY